MNPSKTSLLSVIIPCYNEATTVALVVERVRQSELPEGWQKEIIIVDDGSREDTLLVLRSLEENVRVVYRETNGGKGAAVKDGLREASGDYCIIQDADLELDPNDYSDLLAPIVAEDADVVFGYRVLENKHAPVQPTLFYGGYMLSLLFNISFGTRFKDIPACYKLFPRTFIPELLRAPSDDFVFDAVELTCVLSRAGHVAQVPIHYYPRTHAQGKKLRLEHGMQCVIAIILMRLGLHHLSIAKEMDRIARFLIAGVVAVFVNLLSLYLLTRYAHIWYLVSSMIAFSTSYVVSFVLQKFWTFKNKEVGAIAYQLPLHLLLALFNLVLNTILIFALVEWGHVWYMFAQALATIIISLDSFILSKKIFS